MQTAALKCDGDGLSFSMGDRQEKRLFFGKKRLKFEMSWQAEVLFVLLGELEIEGAMDELSRE